MAEIILDKINYTYSDGTAYEIQALKDVNLQIHQFWGHTDIVLECLDKMTLGRK